MKNLLLAALCFMLPMMSYAYPENTRLGYSSCSSCHVSPTGSGLLTNYGRELTEDKFSTWASKDSSKFLHGATELPKWLNVGGNIRYLSLDIDNDLFSYKRNFLMQAEVELAFQVWNGLQIVGSFGSYDNHSDSQQHYLLYQYNDNWVFRAGRFMPAFGLQIAEHTASTRKHIFFDEGNESFNAEVGYIDEWGEIFLDAVVGGSGGGTGEKETGATAKVAFYVLDNSQVGASIMSLSGPGYERTGYGPQLVLGLPANFYLLTDYIVQSRKLKASGGAEKQTEDGYFSFTKIANEVTQGLHLAAILDQRQADRDSEITFFQGLGPQITWYPYPHFEISTNYQTTKQKFFGREIKGSVMTTMLHYYF
ncbi:MAG: hypothetical protein KBD78_10875 [Oligoflexales bacterium]|nr:hypothetical protein [Oligoflexales bacterium]